MCPNRKINRQGGFSMIELMISMATMTIVTGAAFALIGSSIKFSSATYHLTDTEQGLRTAQEIINRDLTTAGDGERHRHNSGSPGVCPVLSDPNTCGHLREPKLRKYGSGYLR